MYSVKDEMKSYVCDAKKYNQLFQSIVMPYDQNIDPQLSKKLIEISINLDDLLCQLERCVNKLDYLY